MTSFEHQKNSAPHHLLEALTPVSYAYGFIDFYWIKSFNTLKRHRVKYGLDYFLDHFLDYFLDHFEGGKHTISTEGGVG